MTKSVLIAEVTKNVEGLTARQIEVIVDTVFDGMKWALAHGEKIEIRGFGNFRIKQRDSRVTRNPKTGDTVQVPPRKAIHFKIGKPFHDAINSGK